MVKAKTGHGVFLFFLSVILFSFCSSQIDRDYKEVGLDLEKFSLIHEIKSDKKTPFYIDFNNYPSSLESLPIGVFDSGTGGLTVLNAILEMDLFDNSTREMGSDGIPDFVSEKFVYLGDKANMPYGRYPSEGKTDFLKELIIKDVQFLMRNTYYLSPTDSFPKGKKDPVKVIAIACNTASAYGYEMIEKVIKDWGVEIKTFGIIDAGAHKAFKLYGPHEKGFIGVFATEGTCDSKGYIRALEKYFTENKRAEAEVIQQPCFGLAGAVDGDPAYISKDAVQFRGSGSYLGPSLDHDKYPIDLALWEEYNFEDKGALLTETDVHGNIKEIEINSIKNYIRYYVTTFVSKAVETAEGEKIHSIILGCTHYALFKEEFRDHFLYLRTINEKYRKFIPENIVIIDPAEEQAISLYLYLKRNDLFGQNKNQETQFFISIPNPLLENSSINSRGEFLDDYKYGRFINESRLYVKRVPLKKEYLSGDIVVKLKNSFPVVYELLFQSK